MKISEQGIELIKKFEGFSGKAYFCPAGKLTIGYGHIIVSGEKFASSGISEAEAEEILWKDVELAENAIEKLVEAELLQCQFDALCSFVYNIGAKAFKKSKLLMFINDVEFDLAAAEFDRWIYAGGKELLGLINRRTAEKQMFLGGL